MLASKACLQQHQVNIHSKKHYITQHFPGKLGHMMLNVQYIKSLSMDILIMSSRAQKYNNAIQSNCPHSKSKCKNAPKKLEHCNKYVFINTIMVRILNFIKYLCLNTSQPRFVLLRRTLVLLNSILKLFERAYFDLLYC